MGNIWIERLKDTKTDEDIVIPEYNLDRGYDSDKFKELRKAVHRDVVDQYNIRSGMDMENDDYSGIMDTITESIEQQGQNLTRAEKLNMAQEVYDDVIGLGPLEPLIRDNNVTEIMVNGPYQIFIERGGKIQRTGVHFQDDDHVLRVINRIVAPLGRRCDESSPMVDARLQDGSRVNAIIPPVAVSGPSITIRKFSARPLEMGDLIGFNTLSNTMAHFLEACVRGRCNIIVSGGTGSGKTTLLNVLSGYIPDSERIVTIEDAAELQLNQNHVITLESRPSNIEGKGEITIRDLVKNSLRMRPDRIIVGEVRLGETLDMLQAMNTGHEGSLTTVHSNTARDSLSRLETMVMMSGMELPIKAIREQIASAIDIIVHQARFRDGSRKIVNISEVLGMEGDIITMQDIFVYESHGFDEMGRIKGIYTGMGIIPQIVDKIRDNGIICKDEWFRKV
ncbi:MAG TPA: CpaF family protein [Clostridia bacterium]|nr:CpaF family protein [Clostridia bacterium]